jgi:hypothetical protein
MRNRVDISMIVQVAGLICGSLALAQDARPQQSGTANSQKAAAPSAP